MVPASFWTLIDSVREPSIAKHLVTKVAQHYSSPSGEYDIAGIVKTPLLQSIYQETSRLRLATYFSGKIGHDGFHLDDQWTLRKGSSVVAFSNDVALNTEAWSKARPRTVEQPLEKFWAQRFLVSERTSKTPRAEQSKSSIAETGRFTLEGLEEAGLVFASDQQHILGPEYLQAIQTATLAVLLTEFELQLCNPEAIDASTPPLLDKAFGRPQLSDRVGVRIRKHTANGRR